MPDAELGLTDRDRRKLVLKVCAGQFVISAVCAGSVWYARTERVPGNLALMLLPVVCTCAFLIALCAGLPILSPWPRLKPATALAMPTMFAAILVTITFLLTSRESAQLEPQPAQKLMEVWLESRTIIVLLITQVTILLLASLLFAHPAPKPEEA